MGGLCSCADNNNQESSESLKGESVEAELDQNRSDAGLSIEKLFLHGAYTDLGFVEIHEFSERSFATEEIANLFTGDSVSDGVFVEKESKLLEPDYWKLSAYSDYCYVGEMNNDRPDGFGVIYGYPVNAANYVLSSEPVLYYAGYFKNGVKNGYGIEFSANEYDISYAVSQIASLGILNDEQGEILCQYLFNYAKYEGMFKDNEYHGKGNVFQFPIFDGEVFLEPELHPVINEYIWGNAYPNVIKGKYSKGEANGHVLYYIDNYLYYDGKMVDGEFSGNGTLYYSNGEIAYRGSFSDGRKNGKGTLYDEQGNTIYSGNWINDEYDI